MQLAIDPQILRGAKGRSRAERMAPLLADLYVRYHHAKWIGMDPLAWARAYEDRGDREVAALLASVLAYGNVTQINRSLRDLLRRLGRSPASFARNFVPGRSDAALEGFYHRFNNDRDLCALIHAIGQMLRGWGSVEGFWAQAQSDSDEGGDIADRADHFISAALELDFRHYFPDAPAGLPRSFRYLFPRAGGPSACKRLNLFLRWVVRPDDGIDLGLWETEKPEALQFPVDTHILRISRYLGATRRKSADARTRREITRFFARIDPEDPVRFDFSLCRMGILRACPPKRDLALCAQCDLEPGCLRRRRLGRSAAPISRSRGAGAS